MIANTLDLKDYLETTGNASKRTRLATIVLVVACVLSFVGFLNSLRAGWMLGRLHAAKDPHHDYVKQKLGFDPEVTDQRYIDFYNSLSRAYIENAMIVRIPFFGASFDINDLGLLSGIGFVTILLMLRFSLRNEMVSLNLAFKAAMEVGKNDPKQLEAFYDLLAMRMVLTLPNMEHASVSWDMPRAEVLPTISKLIYFSPFIVYSFLGCQDYITQDIGNSLNPFRTTFLLIYTFLFWISILALSVWCYQTLGKIDGNWRTFWEKIHSTELAKEPTAREIVKGA